MLKCEVGKEIDCKIATEGTILDFINDICNIAQGIHDQLKRNSPLEAKLFRGLLIQAIAQPATWAPVERTGDK